MMKPAPDIAINRNITPDELKRATAKVLNVLPEQVLVTEEYPHFLNNLESFRVVCWFWALGVGDFPFRLQVIPLEEELLPTMDYEMEGAFCEALGCQALMSGDTASPYVLIFVRGKNNYQRVEVNDDLLDEKEWFHIEKYLDFVETEP